MKPVHLLACLIGFSSMLAGQAGDLSSVEGQVVSSATGAPLRRAVVTLYRTSGRAVRPGEPPQTTTSPGEVETDDQGRFAFRDLEAGGYRVNVQRQGFVNQNLTGASFANSQLWLGEGQQLTGYVVRVTPQSVITGKVVDEYGEPVMGAQVYAQRAGSGIGGRSMMTGGNVQSNDLGEYRIANLSAGDYTVAATPQNRNRAFAPGNQPLSEKPQLVYATTYHPGTAVAGEAAVVHVADGAVAGGIDVKLAKVNAFTIRGTIVDPGAPPNGPRAFPQLRLRDAAGLPGGGYFGATGGGQDGAFQFNGVPAGSYELFAQRNNIGSGGSVASAVMPIDVRDKNLDGIVVQVKPNSDLQGTVKLEQPGQCDPRNMTVNLRPAGGISFGGGAQPATVGDDLKFTLKSVPAAVYAVNVNGGMGRCYVKSIVYGGQTAPDATLTVNESGPLEILLAPYSGMLSVTVLDHDGNPLPRARITIAPKDGGGTTGSTTGPTGQMSFGSFRPGSYEVYAWENANPSVPQTPDYLKAFESRAKAVTVGESGRATVEVTAIAASESGGAAAPTPPAGAKGSLAGKVVNGVSGAPIAGAAISLRGQSILTNEPQAMQETSVVTDDQGGFAFPNLTPGSYTLTAQQQRFVGAGAGLPMNPFPQVIVGEGQQIPAYVLKLIPAGVIAGAVTDESGEPVLGARVQLFRYRNDAGQRRLVAASTTQTDDLGKYRIANLAPGNYYVSATRVGSGPNALRVTTDAMTGLATPLNTPASVADSITEPMPSEAETGYVAAWYPNSPQPAAASAVRVTVGATAANIDMTLRKTRVVRIRGKVVDSMGGVVGTPSVTLMPKNSPVVAPGAGGTVVARDGSFEISGVAPGSYNLIARPGPIGGGVAGSFASGPPSFRMAVQSIEVKESPIEGIRLELNAGRAVKGSITMDAGGAVVRPAYFSLTSPESGGGTINIGNDGTFTVNSVFPLVYTLNSQSLPANCYVKSIRYAGHEVQGASIEFTGQGALEIVLGASAAILEGSVTGGDGKPAGNAGIVVAPASGSFASRTGNADAHGNFYFANLPPGEYKVVAWDAATPEAADPPESLGSFASAAKTVKLAENAREKVQVTVAK